MVTSVCFGGAGLGDLFVVTGDRGAPKDVGAAVYRTAAPTPGLPVPDARVRPPERLVSLRGAAFIAGAYEHPRRDIPDRTVAQVHAEVADGALRDAGLTFADVDAYYCAGDAPGFGAPVDGRVLRPAGPHVRLVRDRRLVVPRARRPRRGDDRRRPRQRRADHARRAAPQRRRPAGGRRAHRDGAGVGVREPVGLERAGQLRARRPPPHARVRHDERAAGRDQGRRLAARPAQPARLPPRRRDRRGRPRLAGRRRSAAPPRLLRDHRRRRRGRRRQPRGGGVARPHVRQDPRARRGDEGLRRRTRRPHLHRRRVVGAGGVRRGRRHAGRHRLRVDLRQLHDHRADHARGPRLLRQGRGRAVRPRRPPRRAARRAAVQHRRRRPVQQPPGEPRRDDEDHRGRAPGPRRGQPGRPGARRPARAGPRHRRGVVDAA